MTVIEQVKQELESLAPKKVQDCEAVAHRFKELMAKVLVVGYKSGFQDAASLVVSYVDGHFKDNKEFACQSLKKHLGEDNMKKLINFCLHYMADLDIPVKR